MTQTKTCAICDVTFETDVTDAEAEAEMRENFGPDVSVEECDVVCDVCYRAIVDPLTN